MATRHLGPHHLAGGRVIPAPAVAELGDDSQTEAASASVVSERGMARELSRTSIRTLGGGV